MTISARVRKCISLGWILIVFEVVFLAVGLPSIVPSHVGFQDMVFGDLTSIARGRLHDWMISFCLPFHLFFIVVCVYVTLPFAMFATPNLDSILLRIWKIVSGIKSELWFIRGWLPFSLTQSFVVLHRHRRLVCACLVCE
ncbi:LOW QUALITY PROTEIN: hypothetical protein HID58_071040, partial [Brassica napus]